MGPDSHAAIARAALERYLPLGEISAATRSPGPDPTPLCYPTAPRVPLPWRGPAAAPGSQYDLLARLLRDTYGRIRLEYAAWEAKAFTVGLAGTDHSDEPRCLTTPRRPVASGGDFHPAELYVRSAGDDRLRPGTYHYDPVHHALVMVGSGSPAAAAAEHGRGVDRPRLAIFASCRPWKNAFKYGSFGYRLSCLDLGVVLGQMLALAPVSGRVSFLFPEEADASLGLDPTVQAVYAVVELAAGGAPTAPVAGPAATPAPELISDRSARDRVGPAAVGLYDLARRSPPAPVTAPASGVSRTGDHRKADSRPLPPGADWDPQDAVPHRRSPATVASDQIDLAELAGVLRVAGGGYHSDLDAAPDRLPHVELYCAARSVRGLAPGVYRYDAVHHRLSGQPQAELRRVVATASEVATSVHFVHAPVHLFLVGSYPDGLLAVGARWYRILNMEAGIAAARVQLSCTALGLAGRPLLSFHTSALSTVLGLAPGHATLLHLPIGRPGRWPGLLNVPLLIPTTSPGTVS